VATTETETISQLASLGGEVLFPESAGYDEARRVHNGLVDKHPAAIARCRGVTDVVEAVNAGRELGLEISVRGGGHAVSGTAVTEGGLMIDLSQMKGIHVDVARATARAQPGVLWGELNRETQLHGLAVTGGTVSTTGIAGLTLGGGIGWLMPSIGLATDNLLSADVVTADGRVLVASMDEHPDLFWALRGGGGNFGIVTSFEYRLHRIGPIITGGVVVHPFDAAADLLRFFRGFAGDAPDELMVVAALLHAPDGSGMPVAAIAVGHVGPPAQADRDLAPLLGFGAPLDAQVGPMPYSVINTLLDANYPAGALNHWKSAFLRDLSDEAIDDVVTRFGACPSPISLIAIEHFHGAVTRVPVDATAMPHREPGFNLLITSVWTDPDSTAANVEWTREAFDGLDRFVVDRRYVNYLDADDADDDAVNSAFGRNYERLGEIKRVYDPENVFHLNTNVRPADGS